MSQAPSSARIAIITRTKERPLLLERARKSIAGQSFRDFDWIVVNDGGEAGPVDAVVEKALSSGITTRVIHNSQSLGMEAASNRGIRETNSEFLVIHDDDDSWEPEFLRATVGFLDENPGYAGVVTHSTKVTEKIYGGNVRILSEKPFNDDLVAVYLVDLAVANRYPPISFVFRRSVYDDVGGFDEALPVLGDWDFNLKVAMRGDIGVIPRPLANYHHRPGSRGNKDAYGNTIIDGIAKHHQYDAQLRNQWLRDDLAAGRVGLGMLASLGRLQIQLYPLVNIARVLSRIKQKINLRS